MYEPRKDKTRAFIHNIKTFTFEIRSNDFDLYGLNARVETFGQKQFLSEKQIFNIQLVLEELILHQLLARSGQPVAITVTVGYFEKNNEIELTATYAGAPYNPFTDTHGDDDLSIVIVRKLAKNIDYSCSEEKNKLRLTM